jgi:hypothetical protein
MALGNRTKQKCSLIQEKFNEQKNSGNGFPIFRRGRLRLRRSTERGGGRQSPMVKLMNDLQQAPPRAKLSGDQNDKLQSDIAALKDAQQARRQGQSVDQDTVQGALNDLHQIADSGAFQDADQKQLDQDFTAIQPPQQ